MVMVAQQYERAGCPRTIYANTLGTDISSHIHLTMFKNRQVQKETGVHTDVHDSYRKYVFTECIFTWAPTT